MARKPGYQTIRPFRRLRPRHNTVRTRSLPSFHKQRIRTHQSSDLPKRAGVSPYRGVTPRYLLRGGWGLEREHRVIDSWELFGLGN